MASKYGTASGPAFNRTKNVQDIITCREIIKLQNQEFTGLEYEYWKVSPCMG